MTFKKYTFLGASFFLVMSILAGFSGGRVHADTASAPPLVLDGVAYSKSTFILDFMRIAFAEASWSADPLNSVLQGRNELIGGAVVRKKFFPSFPNGFPVWLREYIWREQGEPDYAALSRWPQSGVTISTGWPPPSKQRERFKGFSQRAEQQALRHINDLQAAIGLPVRFMNPADETTTDFARIRIVDALSLNFFFDNKFKINGRGYNVVPIPITQPDFMGPPVLSDYAEHGIMLAYEGKLLDAVRFTPFARVLVEGYYVMDEDNNIDFAACYIWPHHQDALFNALVTECLVRAAGLPSVAAAPPEIPVLGKYSALENWNKAHDSHSKRHVLDGEGVNDDFYSLTMRQTESRVSEGYGEPALLSVEENAKIQAYIEDDPSYFPHRRTETEKVPQALTDYDKAMLNMLYCTRLKTGASRFQVFSVLFNDSYCFDQVRKKFAH